MAWRCKECNMTFDSQQLYDTHKRKFCVGSSVDPARIRSRISGKGGKSNERKDKDVFQTVSETEEYLMLDMNASISSDSPENITDSNFYSVKLHLIRSQTESIKYSV